MRGLKYIIYLIIGSTITLSSCEKFFNPEQGNVLDEDDFYQNWEEYRAAEMGLYAIQQTLVEQLVVLGELRADLLEVTDQADRDLLEIYNFDVTPTNKYASPVNFYKLIAACNNLKTKLEIDFPGVLDKGSEITRYDRLYGEVLCMRAWAYWNAVRIYGKVPYIWPSLSDISEIEEYVNTSRTYTDSLFVIYAPDGYHNDTIRDTTFVLNKTYLDFNAVVDTFTNELENKVKAVGVIHNQDFNDQTWDVSIWNRYAMNALLGQMYFFDQNYNKALEHFNPIMFNYESETNNVKFGLDNKLSYGNWDNILSQIDPYEHIFSLWFNKSYQQINGFQSLFSFEFPNKYMMKPTWKAVEYWENMWNGMSVQINNTKPDETRLNLDAQGNPRRGTPGDFYRGYGVSYGYYKDDKLMNSSVIREMLINKAEGNINFVKTAMEDVDTVVYKYSFNKNAYDQDANFMIYRAAGIHMAFAEIHIWRIYLDEFGVERNPTHVSLQVLNDGSYNSDPAQLGVRGRVGFADGQEKISVGDIVYFHDPNTNDVSSYKRLNSLISKQYYLEEKLLEEKAREMAYEGERFYDLMRIAKRRGDPSFLANKVAEKFKGEKKEQIRAYLMNEDNWYIPLFEK